MATGLSCISKSTAPSDSNVSQNIAKGLFHLTALRGELCLPCPIPTLPISTPPGLHLLFVPQTPRGLSQLGQCRERAWGYSERSICAANCPRRPTNSNPAPIQAPEHMVLLAPLSPIHFLFKSIFPFQAKNIRSRKTEEQQTKLQICLLLLHPNSARLFLPMEGHQRCRTLRGWENSCECPGDELQKLMIQHLLLLLPCDRSSRDPKPAGSPKPRLTWPKQLLGQGSTALGARWGSPSPLRGSDPAGTCGCPKAG